LEEDQSHKNRVTKLFFLRAPIRHCHCDVFKHRPVVANSPHYSGTSRTNVGKTTAQPPQMSCVACVIWVLTSQSLPHEHLNSSSVLVAQRAMKLTVIVPCSIYLRYVDM